MQSGTFKLDIRNTAAGSAGKGRRGQTGTKQFMIMRSAGAKQ